MASFKDGVMGNSTKPLSNNFIDIGKKPKNPKDKKKLIEKIFLGVLFVGVGAFFLNDVLNNVRSNMADTNSSQALVQPKAKQDTKPTTNTSEQAPQEQPTKNLADQKQVQEQSVASKEAEMPAQTKKTFLPSDWNKKIQALFLNQPRIILNKEKPIIEVNNFDIFSKDKPIDLPGYEAIIKPAYLSITNSDITINIEIVSKEDNNIYLQKFFPLKNNGFNPIYFKDCIVFNDDVYIAGDKILFFTIKSIEEKNHIVRVVLSYNGQDIVINKEI